MEFKTYKYNDKPTRYFVDGKETTKGFYEKALEDLSESNPFTKQIECTFPISYIDADLLYKCFNIPKKKEKIMPKLPNGVGIKRVKFNDPATIIWWDDGTKTVAVAGHGDKFNKEVGFNVCLNKKLLGNKVYHKFLNEYVFNEEDN